MTADPRDEKLIDGISEHALTGRWRDRRTAHKAKAADKLEERRRRNAGLAVRGPLRRAGIRSGPPGGPPPESSAH